MKCSFRRAMRAGGRDKVSAGKILVVDYDPHTRRAIMATLMAHGYEVLGARTGVRALKTIPLEMPHLVLLDMDMPGVAVWRCAAGCAPNPTSQ